MKEFLLLFGLTCLTTAEVSSTTLNVAQDVSLGSSLRGRFGSAQVASAPVLETKDIPPEINPLKQTNLKRIVSPTGYNINLLMSKAHQDDNFIRTGLFVAINETGIALSKMTMRGERVTDPKHSQQYWHAFVRNGFDMAFSFFAPQPITPLFDIDNRTYIHVAGPYVHAIIKLPEEPIPISYIVEDGAVPSFIPSVGTPATVPDAIGGNGTTRYGYLRVLGSTFHVAPIPPLPYGARIEAVGNGVVYVRIPPAVCNDGALAAFVRLRMAGIGNSTATGPAAADAALASRVAPATAAVSPTSVLAHVLRYCYVVDVAYPEDANESTVLIDIDPAYTLTTHAAQHTAVLTIRADPVVGLVDALTTNVSETAGTRPRQLNPSRRPINALFAFIHVDLATTEYGDTVNSIVARGWEEREAAALRALMHAVQEVVCTPLACHWTMLLEHTTDTTYFVTLTYSEDPDESDYRLLFFTGPTQGPFMSTINFAHNPLTGVAETGTWFGGQEANDPSVGSRTSLHAVWDGRNTMFVGWCGGYDWAMGYIFPAYEGPCVMNLDADGHSFPFLAGNIDLDQRTRDAVTWIDGGASVIEAVVIGDEHEPFYMVSSVDTPTAQGTAAVFSFTTVEVAGDWDMLLGLDSYINTTLYDANMRELSYTANVSVHSVGDVAILIFGTPNVFVHPGRRVLMQDPASLGGAYVAYVFDTTVMRPRVVLAANAPFPPFIVGDHGMAVFGPAAVEVAVIGRSSANTETTEDDELAYIFSSANGTHNVLWVGGSPDDVAHSVVPAAAASSWTPVEVIHEGLVVTSYDSASDISVCSPLEGSRMEASAAFAFVSVARDAPSATLSVFCVYTNVTGVGRVETLTAAHPSITDSFYLAVAVIPTGSADATMEGVWVRSRGVDGTLYDRSGNTTHIGRTRNDVPWAFATMRIAWGSPTVADYGRMYTTAADRTGPLLGAATEWGVYARPTPAVYVRFDAQHSPAWRVMGSLMGGDEVANATRPTVSISGNHSATVATVVAPFDPLACVWDPFTTWVARGAAHVRPLAHGGARLLAGWCGNDTHVPVVQARTEVLTAAAMGVCIVDTATRAGASFSTGGLDPVAENAAASSVQWVTTRGGPVLVVAPGSPPLYVGGLEVGFDNDRVTHIFMRRPKGDTDDEEDDYTAPEDDGSHPETDDEPAPVPVPEPVASPDADQPIPPPVPLPVPVAVSPRSPQPLLLPFPVPVAIPAPIPVAIPAPHPVRLPAPQPVRIPVPVPVPFPVPPPVPIAPRAPTPRAPFTVPVGGPYPTSVQPAPTVAPQAPRGPVPFAPRQPALEPVPVPVPIPVPVPETAPDATPDATSDATPDATLDATPDATPDAAPTPLPVPVPQATVPPQAVPGPGRRPSAPRDGAQPPVPRMAPVPQVAEPVAPLPVGEPVFVPTRVRPSLPSPPAPRGRPMAPYPLPVPHDDGSASAPVLVPLPEPVPVTVPVVADGDSDLSPSPATPLPVMFTAAVPALAVDDDGRVVSVPHAVVDASPNGLLLVLARGFVFDAAAGALARARGADANASYAYVMRDLATPLRALRADADLLSVLVTMRSHTPGLGAPTAPRYAGGHGRFLVRSAAPFAIGEVQLTGHGLGDDAISYTDGEAPVSVTTPPDGFGVIDFRKSVAAWAIGETVTPATAARMRAAAEAGDAAAYAALPAHVAAVTADAVLMLEYDTDCPEARAFDSAPADPHGDGEESVDGTPAGGAPSETGRYWLYRGPRVSIYSVSALGYRPDGAYTGDAIYGATHHRLVSTCLAFGAPARSRNLTDADRYPVHVAATVADSGVVALAVHAPSALAGSGAARNVIHLDYSAAIPTLRPGTYRVLPVDGHIAVVALDVTLEPFGTASPPALPPVSSYASNEVSVLAALDGASVALHGSPLLALTLNVPLSRFPNVTLLTLRDFESNATYFPLWQEAYPETAVVQVMFAFSVGDANALHTDGGRWFGGADGYEASYANATNLAPVRIGSTVFMAGMCAGTGWLTGGGDVAVDGPCVTSVDGNSIYPMAGRSPYAGGTVTWYSVDGLASAVVANHEWDTVALPGIARGALDHADTTFVGHAFVPSGAPRVPIGAQPIVITPHVDGNLNLAIAIAAGAIVFVLGGLCFARLYATSQERVTQQRSFDMVVGADPGNMEMVL